jgi:hypothetical protein
VPQTVSHQAEAQQIIAVWLYGEAILIRGLLSACLTFTLLTFLLCPFSSLCLGAEVEDARKALSNAEAMVAECYRALVNAEGDGANITDLVGVINGAGWLLSMAKLAYGDGDYESAIIYADECQSMLEGFIDRAEALRREAQEAGRRDFMFNFVGSGFGALGILFGGYAAWLYLVRREERRGSVEH